MRPRIWIYRVLIWLLAIGNSVSAQDTTAPRVWIFNGTPGDSEHHAFYEKNLALTKKALTERFGIPAENLTILYGPKSAGYDGACSREALLAELAKIVAHTKQPSAAPAWLIFQGHANAIPGGANFNLPGPDINTRDLGESLKSAASRAPLVIVATTACSSAFVRPLAAPGRMIIAASTPADPENETEFPQALTEALESSATDTNRDGLLSVTELFLACHALVQQIYQKQSFMIKEHAQLDGNGDGRGTQRPAPADAEPAALVGLRIAKPEKKFE